MIRTPEKNVYLATEIDVMQDIERTSVSKRTQSKVPKMQKLEIARSGLETLVFVINDVVHTLNNSVGIAKGNLSFIQQSKCSAEQLEMIEDIDVAIERLGALSNRLERYSLHRPFQACEFELKDFMANIVCSMERGGISFSINAESSLNEKSIVFADLDYLLSAINLLLCEFIAHQPETNHIHLELFNLANQGLMQETIQREKIRLKLCFSDVQGVIADLEQCGPLKMDMATRHRIGDSSFNLAFISLVVHASDGEIYFESSPNSAKKLLCIVLPFR